MTSIFINPDAKSWTYTYVTDVSLAQQFHQKLTGYKPTPLIPLPSLAKDLGVWAVFAKDESSRMDLPAFKVLGASWGTHRAIVAKTGIPLTSTPDELSVAARNACLSLFAATSGNHGRAIAYTAKKLGIPATIFLGGQPNEQVLDNISSEGAKVIVVKGDYDDAVAEAARQTKATPGGLHIQDYTWGGCGRGCEEIAEWVVEGYSTMMHEIEQQLEGRDFKATHLVTPIGAGTLGLAVVAHAKSERRRIRVVAVEPTAAACLHHNLKQDKLETIPTADTIMTGMICGNVNPVSWPVLRCSVDVSVTITDKQCHQAVGWLHENGIDAGPCGASTLAGLREVIAADRIAAGLGEFSVVVLLSTEGKRHYEIPE